MIVADGVKIAPANILRPKTFTFTIANYESSDFNMKNWHDVNVNGAQSWLYLYSGSNGSIWSVRFDIRIAFAQPVPLTMPEKKIPIYTVINGKRLKLDEDKCNSSNK
jgi:hypothetical protein